MNEINGWCTLICGACAACILIEFLIPPGKIGKIMNMVLGGFMCCALITPFTFSLDSLNLDLHKVTGEELSKKQNNLAQDINTQMSNIAKENIKAIILGVLKDINIYPKKIEIFMDTSEDNCIVMIRCKIYINQEHSALKEKIKSEVEKKLNIATEVELN